MNDNEKQFEDYIRNIKFDDTPDPNHRDKLEQNLLAAFEKQPRPPKIWRIIMKNPFLKLTAAAVIILAVVLSVTVLDKSITPAWAIEDTIKALEHIHSIKMLGVVSGLNEDSNSIEEIFALWAKPNAEETESRELRLVVPGQTTVVSPSGITFIYHPAQNTVSIIESTIDSRPKIDPWISSKFFQDIKKFTENWKISYGKDEETGKNSVFATCIYAPKSKSWWFQFDSETKLPVRFKQWTNINFEGKPEFYAEKIEYNPELPAGIFEFKIPEGATVIEKN